MAADLAYGTLAGRWTELLAVDSRGTVQLPYDDNLAQYFREVWDPHLRVRDDSGQLSSPTFQVYQQLLIKLIGMGYLTLVAGKHYIASEKAYDLLETKNISIFISYAVRQSSSLALLIWSELQQRGYSPFIDIRGLGGGDEWHALLEQKVRSSDVFVVLLGAKSLESQYVRNEIRWAVAAQQPRIIPIAEPGFDVSAVPDEHAHLRNRNFIAVTEDTSAAFLSMINQLIASIALVYPGR